MARKTTNRPLFEAMLSEIENSLTPEDFVSGIRMMRDFVLERDSLSSQEMTQIAETIGKAFEDAQKRHERQLTTHTQAVQAEAQRTVKAAIEQFSVEFKNRIANVRDGKDADPQAIIDAIVPHLPTLEDIQNRLPALGERIRDSLELLQGDERLDVSAIRGLDEYVSGKQTKAATVQSAFGGASHSPLHEKFTMNGSATYVTLQQGVTANGAAAIVRYNGQVLDETTHYSINGTKVSLTFTPDNNSTISVMYWP